MSSRSPAIADEGWHAPMNGPHVRIPRIIHQTWKTADIPYDIYDRQWVESWTRLHPDWLYVLWTDDRLRQLGRACYAECGAMYGSEVPGIFLADFGRYMVLRHFGGLYVDLDYECLKSLEPLLDGRQFVTSYAQGNDGELNNALIASVPHHPLLARLMTACCDRWVEETAKQPLPDVIEHVGPGPITGPVMMTDVTNDFHCEGHQPITVYEARLLCPIDWRLGLSIHKNTLSRETIARVAQDYPDAYAATYWTHVR